MTFYQCFKFSAAKPVIVETSGSAADAHPDKSFTILTSPTSSLSVESLPPVLLPGGLSLERAKYLYKEIRQFCHAESRDITCPNPEPQEAAQPSED